MGYNVQPLRSQHEINDFLFCLRRNKNAVCVCPISSNSRKRHDHLKKTYRRAKDGENTHFILTQLTGLDSRLYSSEKITKRYIGINEDEISETLLTFRLGF